MKHETRVVVSTHVFSSFDLSFFLSFGLLGQKGGQARPKTDMVFENGQYQMLIKAVLIYSTTNVPSSQVLSNVYSRPLDVPLSLFCKLT